MSNPPINKPFCNYTLLDELGRGGVSMVYRARENGSGKIVALKVLNATVQNNALAKERFRREPKMQFLHPKIVPVLDAGLCDGRMYFTMALIAGDSLERIIKRGPLTPRQLYPYLRDIAEALDAAHQRGIIHRDIKPSNILVRAADNTALLTDFGVAKSSAANMIGLTQPDSNPVGTADYMSPELARVDPNITPASDVYSLGVTVYHALAGRLPFVSENPFVVAHKHANETPPDLRNVQPSISPEVSRVVMRALAKDPLKRYASAGVFANAFTEAVMQSGSAIAPPPAPARNRAGLLIAGVLVLLLALLAGVWVISQSAPATQLPATDAPADHASPVPSIKIEPTSALIEPSPLPAVATLAPTATPAAKAAATSTLAPDATTPPTTEAGSTPASAAILRQAQDSTPTGAPSGFELAISSRPGIERWGRPRTKCSANTDDNDPVQRFEINLNVTNTGTAPLNRLAAQFFNGDGGTMDTCVLQNVVPLAPGQSAPLRLVTFTDGPVITSLVITLDGQSRKVCIAGNSASVCG